MSDLELGIKVRNYKCFGNESQGFDDLKPINVIIGRNNSGKSALLELIRHECGNFQEFTKFGRNGTPPIVRPSIVLNAELIRNNFPATKVGGQIRGNHHEYGRSMIGKRLSWENQGGQTVSADIDGQPLNGFPREAQSYLQNIVNSTVKPFKSKTFRHLKAERDILAEGDAETKDIDPSGQKLTSLFARYINHSDLPSDLIERTFLSALNDVMTPDARFTSIAVQLHRDTSHWEIYLAEEKKGRIPLSHMGSGVKTVILVIAFLTVLPHIQKKKLSDYVFAFEEIENNLHPSLVRRVFSYIREQAKNSDCRFFITTHSNVVIDMFANDELAKILHVTHNGEFATVKSIQTYIHHRGVLDDLDVRASDLLQANGIIWLEGPSDRLYFNRWIEIISAGQLREGTHYQCVFYGGRLLAHFSSETPDVDESELINFLRINRNSIILIDSDIHGSSTKINATKERIKKGFEEIGALAWITDGKEIENYIPMRALRNYFNNPNLDTLRKNHIFPKYLDKIEAGSGNKFLAGKVLFAERIVAHIDRGGIEETLDLQQKLNIAIAHIRSWNSIKP